LTCYFRLSAADAGMLMSAGAPIAPLEYNTPPHRYAISVEFRLMVGMTSAVIVGMQDRPTAFCDRGPSLRLPSATPCID
jgi:hypothetical protein